MLKYNKTFYRIFTSYLIVLVIPMTVLGIVNYNQALDAMEDKIQKDSIAALKQSSYIVDTSIDNLYKLSSELSLNQRIYDFLYTRPETIPELNLLARKIMSDLRGYCILNDFIGDIYIYSKINGVIVSPTGLYTPDIFFSSIYIDEKSGIDYSQRLNSIGKSSFREFKPVKILSNHGHAIEKILYRDSLPNIRDNLGCVMVFMNKAHYTAAFSDVIKGNNVNSYILNEDLQVIISRSSREYDDLLGTNLDSHSGASTISTPDGKALKVHTSSLKNKWKYVSIIPYDAFTKEINRLKLSTIFIISIFVCIAFFISLFAANKNYKPLKNIISFIKTTYDYEDYEGDDYKIISNILESSYKEMESNREVIKNHIPLIRESYLYKLLKGSSEINIKGKDTRENAPLNSLLDIDLNFPNSIVVLFHIIETEEDNQPAQRELYKLALRTAIQDFVADNGRAYAVELDYDNIACIYNSDREEADRAEKDVLALIIKIKEYLENKLDIILYAGIGSAYGGYDNLTKTYEEAEEGLSYALLMNEEIIFYKDILKSNSHFFAFSVQKELQLINYIKCGKQEEALAIISDVYTENCNNKDLTCDMMRFFIYDLYCSIIKAAGESKIRNNELIIDRIKELHNPSMISKDMSFFLLDIKRMVIYTCKLVNDQRKNTSSQLKNNIIQYIEKNFLDNQLSLDSLAEEFNITPQYLSRFFGENFNMNYVDYVNSKRVEKAKEFLNNKEKVKDVAIKSGFNNSGTFINVFKKHIGVTPGEYRQLER